MALKKDLEYYLAQTRRIAAHCEENAERIIRKIYKHMLKDLQTFVSETYVKYAEDDSAKVIDRVTDARWVDVMIT